jgi:site-specific recombinase XerD
MTSRSNPTDIHKLPDLHRSACIYHIAASPHWQFRFHIDGKYIRRSTGEIEKRKAVEKAKRFHAEAFLRQWTNTAVHPTAFGAVAQRFVEWQQTKVKLGAIGQRTHKEDVYILNASVLPFFQTKEASSISKRTIEEYLAKLSSRKLAKSTIHKHVNVIRKILKFALDENIIKVLPGIPAVSLDNKSRAYFSLNEHRRVLELAREYAKRRHVAYYKIRGKNIRKLIYGEDLSDLIEFGINVFIRISDIKTLRHNQITVRKEADGFDETTLQISIADAKTRDGKVATMPSAVRVYERLLKRHKARGFGKPDDYVFYPEYKNRDYALDVMGRLFRNILDDTSLRSDAHGRKRTLYSLRHSALMYRFLYGEKIDIFLLALNALTSVAILQKHYLSHVESLMRVKELQSWKGGNVLYMLFGPGPASSKAKRKAKRN